MTTWEVTLFALFSCILVEAVVKIPKPQAWHWRATDVNAAPEYFNQVNRLSLGLQCDLFKLLPIFSTFFCYIKVLQTE